MSFEKELSNLDWKKEYASLQALLSKDLHMYRILMYTCVACALILLFVFQIALIIALPAAAYFWYATHTSKKKLPIGISFALLRKECWNRPRSPFYKDDPESLDDSYTFYLFIPDPSHYTSYTISEAGLKKYTTDTIAKHFIVYEYIFDAFEKGQQVFFIFSPTNDLVAFYLNKKILPLLVTSTLEKGKEYKTSISLNQVPLKDINRDGFELLKPGEKPERYDA
ncbi:hypothetical protein [Cytophaga aurantiaca]|uniref:hypothetical protein n=1 Tax=Cytophaga aurantiaca TaxID=29530 RepID=UPI000363B732|nr:hypothetical protein [Cytophaga aurantiaca]